MPSLPLDSGPPRVAPQTTQHWKTCQNVSFQLLSNYTKRWHPEFLDLHFRILCLPPSLMKMPLHDVGKFLDLQTMRPRGANYPTLTEHLDFGSRAAQASWLVYRRNDEPWCHKKNEGLHWFASAYLGFVKSRAATAKINGSLDNLRHLAVQCAWVAGANASDRDWTVLIPNEPRWCLAAPKKEWPQLMEEYPQTRPYLEAFGVVSQLMPVANAIQQVWTIQAPEQSLTPEDGFQCY